MNNSFVLYYCYEEFFKRNCSQSELLAILSKYDGYSVLHFVRQLNTNLRIWENGGDTNSYEYLATVLRLLPNILGEQIVYELHKNGAPGRQRRAFFHTRQLLLLTKLALRHCQFGSGLLFGQKGIEAGLILLAINDNLHIKDRSVTQSHDPDVRDYALLSEFVAVNKFIMSDPGDMLLRAYEMLFKIAPEGKDEPCYIDMPAVFASQTGLDLEQYFAMCMSLFVGTMKQFYGRMNPP